jgi:D-alanyl-D-alanine carboxypeptidase
MGTARIPGAMIGIWSPQGRYIKAFGVADTTTGDPMRTDFFSRIGSVTKTFTSTAVLQLVARGRVGLDDPIAEFLTGVPDGEQITVRHLLSMRSGLADYAANPGFAASVRADPRREIPAGELLTWAFTQPAAFEPGQRWQYCNTNYIVLGRLVAEVSGQAMPDYLAEHVLGPLGMSQNSFPDGTGFPDPHARGYTDPENGSGAPEDATDWSASLTGAAGAMISTLDDMRIWARTLAGGELLDPGLVDERLRSAAGTDLPPGVGYGMGVLTAAGWIGHNGSVPGFQSVVVHLPERQTSLVVFLNTDIEQPGSVLPSSALAKAVTSVLTPGHVYDV